MPGEGQEVTADGRYVDRHVRRGLGGVDQDQCACLVRHGSDLANRVDGPQRVAHVGHRQQLRMRRQLRAQVVEIEAAVVADRDVVEGGAHLAGQLLPGNDVGVVLELGGHHPVSGTQVGAAPAVGHQVDRLGRVAHEDDLPL